MKAKMKPGKAKEEEQYAYGDIDWGCDITPALISVHDQGSEVAPATDGHMKAIAARSPLVWMQPACMNVLLEIERLCEVV